MPTSRASGSLKEREVEEKGKDTNEKEEKKNDQERFLKLAGLNSP